jgi:hypothetical protein
LATGSATPSNPAKRACRRPCDHRVAGRSLVHRGIVRRSIIYRSIVRRSIIYRSIVYRRAEGDGRAKSEIRAKFDEWAQGDDWAEGEIQVGGTNKLAFTGKSCRASFRDFTGIPPTIVIDRPDAARESQSQW